MRPGIQGRFLCATLILFAAPLLLAQGEKEELSGKISPASRECLECHESVTPGIVKDWIMSVHASVSPASAMKKEGLSRKLSAEDVPSSLSQFVVGCAECHTLNPDSHKDTFDHGGEKVHVVVTPDDCAVCHPEERNQFSKNLMSNAYRNLMNNSLYQDLVKNIIGKPSAAAGSVSREAPGHLTEADACLSCHGTKVEVEGFKSRKTPFGPMTFPVLKGWPNGGVGRINPDGSEGACTACHPRHRFSMVYARTPNACAKCHTGPDVPAMKVYKVSKHGRLYETFKQDWDFNAVPWEPGEDFSAPTCAVCHVSLLVNASGKVIAKRTHQMNDRLPWRLFGLPYAHPHPRSPDTSIIRNEDGLPLPVSLSGSPADSFLIDEKEQKRRANRMLKICLSCHSLDWTMGYYRRLENTIKETNHSTQEATALLKNAWESGAAEGPAKGDSPFNESIERKWVEHWLFYANSTRFASAMMGADYGVFANGRWQMAKNLQEMAEWLESNEPGKESSWRRFLMKPGKRSREGEENE